MEKKKFATEEMAKCGDQSEVGRVLKKRTPKFKHINE